MGVLIHRQEGERTYAEMFRRYKARVFIAMSAQAFAQLNGINVISYYAPVVFEQAGWIGRDAILMTGINGITYFLSTIPPWYLVDRLGRRPILLSGAVMMTLSLSAISYFLYLDITATPTLVVAFVMIYNAAFGYSWGPIPWLYPPEMYAHHILKIQLILTVSSLPLSIRSKGASLSTATNWAFNWLVGIMTPILIDTIKWRVYLIHAFFCAVSFVVGKLRPRAIIRWKLISRLVYFVYPETRGVRLEDMNRLFNDTPSNMPTPASGADETNSLIRSGSPIPSMDLRGGASPSSANRAGTQDNSNLDVDPPNVHIRNGVPRYSRRHPPSDNADGFFARMVAWTKGGNDVSTSRDGRYKSVDQQDD